MTNWGKIFGTHISKSYKLLSEECKKNVKETLQINQKCQTIQPKNERRSFPAKSQKKFKG